MAKVSIETWAAIKADYEVKGLSSPVLASIYSVSESGIRKKAKNNGWTKGGSARLVQKKANIINEVREFADESSGLSANHLQVIDEEASFLLKSNADMQSIQDKVNVLISKIETPSHALALMTATINHRVARIGKPQEVKKESSIIVQNIMPVPVADSVDDWEEAARSNQNKLLGRDG